MSEGAKVVAFSGRPRRPLAARAPLFPALPGDAGQDPDRPGQGRKDRPLQPPVACAGKGGEPRLDRTLWARVRARLAEEDAALVREREAAGPLYAELMALPSQERLAAAEREPRYWTLALTDRVLDLAQSTRAAATSDRGEEVAALGLALGVRLDAGRYGTSPVIERQGIAWSCHAESRRRQGDLAGAERGFRAARDCFAAEPAEGRERAVYCWFRARLYRDQGEMDEALALLVRAADLFEAWEAPVEAGEARGEHGWLCLELGALTDAEGSFQIASALLHGTAASAAQVRTGLGLALTLVELGYIRDAARELAEARQLAAKLPALDQLRTLVLEARLAERLGKAGLAVARYTRAVAGLMRERAFPEAALATVELASLHAAQERCERTQRLRQKVAPLLVPGTLPDTSRAVLCLALEFAARRDRDGTELLAEAAEFLARALNSPAMRFRPGVESQLELCWDDLDSTLRERLGHDAGLPAAVAALAAAEVPSVEQRLISWTQEELARTRILFAPAGLE